MTLFVGTSGWAYKEWKPDFYPQDLPQSRFLEHYAQQLSACEINATFYRIQSESTFEKWAAAAPDDFRYSIKAHRRITHWRSMVPDETFLKTFLTSLEPLRGRLGVILLQYPPRLERDDEALEGVLGVLPDTIRFAFEFRHESWDDAKVCETIAQSGGTVCVSDTDGTVPGALPPGPLAYVRLRTERYSDQQRTAWFDLLARESGGRDVFAFAKHEGIPTRDEFGGIGLAQWLRAKARV